jgi:GAF domain-containing protein
MRRGAKPAKAKVEAKPPIARKARQSEGSRTHDLEKHLAEAQKREAEALEQQTATAEILRVISSSPTDVQPVFDTIAASASRLCSALYSLVFRFDGEMITLVADHGAPGHHLDFVRSMYPAAPGRSGLASAAVLERRVVAIADAQNDADHPHLAERARVNGFRSVVSVPMLRGDSAIGAINVVRGEIIPFTDKQIALLKTFADQAVIAIENVRLFTELEARNRDVTEALEQQTATSEILRTIAHAQTDAQPVFDTIVQSATRLCHATNAAVFLTDGRMVIPRSRQTTAARVMRSLLHARGTRGPWTWTRPRESPS